MRQNDIQVEARPTHFSKSLQTTASRKKFFGASRKSRLADGPTKFSESQKYHEILDRLKLLSIVSSTLPSLSLEHIATAILQDMYREYNRLRKLDISLLKEGYELFKEDHFQRSLVEFQRGYQMSCLIDFIEREYWTEIEDSVMKDKEKKKSLLQRLEEEREEIKLACKIPTPILACFHLKISVDFAQVKETAASAITIPEHSTSNNSQRTSTGLVSYHCGIIQTIQEIMRYKENYIGNRVTDKDKYEHETRRETVFKVTKKCIAILLECSCEKVDLSRESRHTKLTGI